MILTSTFWCLLVQILVNSSSEYLHQVRGTSGTVNGLHGITSLTLVTNKRTYGPYGALRGKKFQSTPGGKVVGFFGQSGTILNQLGVVTVVPSPATTPHCTHCKCQHITSSNNNKLITTSSNKGSNKVIRYSSTTGDIIKPQLTQQDQTPGQFKNLTIHDKSKRTQDQHTLKTDVDENQQSNHEKVTSVSSIEPWFPWSLVSCIGLIAGCGGERRLTVVDVCVVAGWDAWDSSQGQPHRVPQFIRLGVPEAGKSRVGDEHRQVQLQGRQ